MCIKRAAMQHGVIGLGQATAAGLSADAIHRLVRSGSWIRVRPTVYALWAPPGTDELWHHRLTAGALWLGERSAVSHRAAVVLWGLEGVASAPIEFSTTGPHQSSDPTLLVHRVRSLPANDVVVRGVIRVTSVPRTILDLCAVVEPEAVELALESALRRRLATLDQITLRLAQTGRTSRGRGVLRALVDRHPETSTESALESRVWRVLREGGLPLPLRQHEVRDENGRFVARLDFAYPDSFVGIEADGHRFHSSRQDWSRDLARHNSLTALGWTLYRVTWEDAVRRPLKVIADISRLLENAVQGRSVVQRPR